MLIDSFSCWETASLDQPSVWENIQIICCCCYRPTDSHCRDSNTRKCWKRKCLSLLAPCTKASTFAFRSPGRFTRSLFFHPQSSAASFHLFSHCLVKKQGVDSVAGSTTVLSRMDGGGNEGEPPTQTRRLPARPPAWPAALFCPLPSSIWSR